MPGTSRIPGFYKLTVEQRRERVREICGLDEQDLAALAPGGLPMNIADSMIENVIGTMEIPVGIATNFLINGKEYLVPMATEETSVVAAASNAARIAREGGGFRVTYTGSYMIGQVQILGVADLHAARLKLLESKPELLGLANQVDPMLVRLGGGAVDLEPRVVDSPAGKMLVAHLVVKTQDAMGANAVNSMAEALGPVMAEMAGGRVNLRIISNLADKRLVMARTSIPAEALGGEQVVDSIITAYAFAATDPYRAATHNKGIMNGITAVVLATGNDTRAVEAGAHAYAARGGKYSSLTTWEKDSNGNLSGTLELPLAVGLIGGATKVHPAARAALKILGVESAAELAQVMGAVGLAQNLAALKALATEGIQRGHMSLHAKNIAIMAGASGDLVDRVAARLVEEGRIRLERAMEILSELGGGKVS